jgi:hypothetical protein
MFVDNKLKFDGFNFEYSYIETAYTSKIMLSKSKINVKEFINQI